MPRPKRYEPNYQALTVFIALCLLLPIFAVSLESNRRFQRLTLLSKQRRNALAVVYGPIKDKFQVDELTQKVAGTAMKAVEMSDMRGGRSLDFSEASLSAVEEMLEEVAAFYEELTPEQREIAAQDFGCYILEVARREFGGKYAWFEQRDQPVLVVGEPAFRIALITWDKVRGRLSGDAADNIPFFYTGFAERVRRAEPGTDALYV